MKIINTKTTSSQEVIAETIKVLESGGLIIFPTETTYGAGVDATNPQAVQKLLTYKSRREGKPLSIAVANKAMASKYVAINDQANALFEQFLPGPITVICKDLGLVSPGVASEFACLGIRIPNYQLILNLIEQYKKPITATSANGSGKKRPYKIDDIFNNLSEKQKGLIDLVLDAGELPHNDPSTVIDTTLSTPVTIRGDKYLQSELVTPGGDDSFQTRPAMQEGDQNQKIMLISQSEAETQEIAGKLILKNWNEVRGKGLVIALNGSLGTGKTIFAKGVAKFLKIDETIKSPTYSYIEEYDFNRHQTSGKLYHLDMWKVEDKNMFERLEVETLIGKNNIIVIEWFDQIAEYITPLLNDIPTMRVNLTQKGEIRELDIEQTNI